MSRRRTRRKINSSPGEESPDTALHSQLPPLGNVGRCAICKRMIDACLIEISRRTPTEGILTQRAYACKDHASEVAGKLVHNLASWTTWTKEEKSE